MFRLLLDCVRWLFGCFQLFPFRLKLSLPCTDLARLRNFEFDAMGKRTVAAIYKQDVTEVPEQRIMEEWAENLWEVDRIGRWRPLHDMLWDPPKGSWRREEGLLVKNGIEWDLFFHQRADFDYKVMAAKLSEHPFVNDCNFEKEKTKWEHKLSAVGDVWKWCANDHLSPKDMCVRTNNNVATLFGYSKRGDGPQLPKEDE